MEPVTIVFGVALLCFGICSLFARIIDPSKFKKLEAMKMLYGEKIGNRVHVVAYTIVPIFMGIYFIVLGIKGVKIF